jgi:hypothetical protein
VKTLLLSLLLITVALAEETPKLIQVRYGDFTMHIRPDAVLSIVPKPGDPTLFWSNHQGKLINIDPNRYEAKEGIKNGNLHFRGQAGSQIVLGVPQGNTTVIDVPIPADKLAELLKQTDTRY